ncbi:hypothetical protein EW145_g6797 [Phellinidium pouzarii]|uniref:Uncharacterized protein n=1 Tax=Phellinidium pouzarii TaxID=167371 RepID=A0A4S4KUX9_9AGAM|nr:hypothetical protein EW145_g6797 [Phellinidium pouzarii]
MRSTLPNFSYYAQVSSEYTALITNDKQLWTYIFERDIKARGLCYPSNLRPIEEASATQIESWVKHAYSLEKRYSTPNLKTIALRVKVRGRVMWAKLLRGRWCLIASADSASSELSIWDISSSSDIRLRTKVHLRAPVFDGQLEDTGDFIHVAVTVATTDPSIMIFNLHQTNDEDIVLTELAEIVGAAPTLMLKGPYVGFATWHGDDTFPFIYNWKTGSSVELRYHVEQDQSDLTPLPVERCAAMAIWTSFVIVVLRSELLVFNIEWSSEISERNTVSSVTPFTTVAIPESHRFRDHKGVITIKAGDVVGSVMRWYIHNLLLLLRSDGMGKDVNFSFIEDPEHERETDDLLIKRYYVILSCVGTTGKRLCSLSPQRKRRGRWTPPMLNTTPIHTTMGHIDTCKVQYRGVHSTIGDPVQVSRAGLPLPHGISCLDFDDGCGIALLGTLSGEFCLTFFTEKNILAPESLLHDLPLVDHFP